MRRGGASPGTRRVARSRRHQCGAVAPLSRMCAGQETGACAPAPPSLAPLAQSQMWRRARAFCWLLYNCRRIETACVRTLLACVRLLMSKRAQELLQLDLRRELRSEERATARWDFRDFDLGAAALLTQQETESCERR